MLVMTNEGKLVHVDNSDYLMHWKYIKRVRKNGKWVYQYAKNALGGSAKAAMQKADKAEREAGKNFIEAQRVNRELNKRAINDGLINRAEKKLLDMSAENTKNKEQEWLKAGDEYAKKLAAYNKTPMGVASNIAKKTKNVVNKILFAFGKRPKTKKTPTDRYK